MDQVIKFFSIEILQNDWIIHLATLCGFIVLGYLVKNIIHLKLKKDANQSKWKGDDVIVNAIESQILFWFTLFSLYIINKDLPISYTFINYSETFLKILLVVSFTKTISTIVLGFFQIWSEQQVGGLPSTIIFTNIVRIIIYTIGVLIILEMINVSIAPLLTALGVGGLAVSLALKDTLSDIFAGLHILLSKKVKPGDFISLDSGEMGYIQDITWRNTKMLERSNNIIHIPNIRLSSAIIKNYDTRDPAFSVKIPVGVGYNSDLEHVGKVIMEVANDMHAKMDEINKDTLPSFKFRAFGESSIDLAVYFRGNKYGDQNPIIHQFIKNIHERFNKEGIEIPYPIRTVINP